MNPCGGVLHWLHLEELRTQLVTSIDAEISEKSAQARNVQLWDDHVTSVKRYYNRDYNFIFPDDNT